MNVKSIVCLATIVSGAAALFHETLWMRSFSLVLGSTVQAAALVFAAFVVGLAAGARLAGMAAPRLARSVLVYTAVEAGIGLSGAACGLVLHLHGDAIAVLLGPRAGAGAGFGVAVVLTLVPTMLMGATFPVLLQVYSVLSGRARAGVGAIYGSNTLGAAAGALACGFLAIPFLGMTGSICLAAGLNLLSGALLLPLIGVKAGGGGQEADGRETVSGNVPEGVLLGLSLFSGAMIFAMEVVFTRFASYCLGNRVYAFTTLLAFVLLNLSLGAYLSGPLSRRFGKDARTLVGAVVLAGSAGVTVSGLAVMWWIRQQFAVEAVMAGNPSMGILLKIGVFAVLMTPCFLVAGLLFPLVLTSSRNIETQSGRTAGRYYLWNAIGSVGGSLVAGYHLVPAIGVMGVTTTAAFAGGMMALYLCATSFLARRSLARASLVVATIGATVLPPSALPEELAVFQAGETPVFRQEDEYGIFQVSRMQNGQLKVTNNRTELVYRLGALSTSYVQQMQGHLGVLYRPGARKAIVLGSGYGITAGAIGLHPGIERVDAVEIIPAMVGAAGMFEPFNLRYHGNPKVRVIVDDGRHFLQRAEERYDIISINVSDPHLPGASSLFHLEFYEVVKSHLVEGGIVIQHAFGSDIAVVLSTLRMAFPHMLLYPAYRNGFNVVASMQPLHYDRDAARALLGERGVAEQMRMFGLLDPLDPATFFSFAIRPEDRPDLFGGAIATDDHPLLEFSRTGGAGHAFFSNE